MSHAVDSVQSLEGAWKIDSQSHQASRDAMLDAYLERQAEETRLAVFRRLTRAFVRSDGSILPLHSHIAQLFRDGLLDLTQKEFPAVVVEPFRRRSASARERLQRLIAEETERVRELNLQVNGVTLGAVAYDFAVFVSGDNQKK